MVGEHYGEQYLALIQTIEIRRGDSQDWEGGCFTEVADLATAAAGQTILLEAMGFIPPEVATARLTQIEGIIVGLPSLQTPETAAGAMTTLSLLGFS